MLVSHSPHPGDGCISNCHQRFSQIMRISFVKNTAGILTMKFAHKSKWGIFHEAQHKTTLLGSKHENILHTISYVPHYGTCGDYVQVILFAVTEYRRLYNLIQTEQTPYPSIQVMQNIHFRLQFRTCNTTSMQSY